MRYLLLMVLPLLLNACVSPIPLKEQTPDLVYKNDGVLAIAVVDERQRVKDGKPANFVGIAHASFGIPVDWHVNQVLATEDGDKDKNLAEFLRHRIVAGMNENGWQAVESSITSQPTDNYVTTMEDVQADELLVLTLKEWYFSVNLNWVTAFNFDTDVNIDVYQKNLGPVLSKQIKERDVIEEKSDESPQNNVLRAYRDQLVQILSDPEVQAALQQSETLAKQ